MADPDLQITGGGHPDSEIREGRAPRASPLDPPLLTHALLNEPREIEIFPLLPRLPT